MYADAQQNLVWKGTWRKEGKKEKKKTCLRNIFPYVLQVFISSFIHLRWRWCIAQHSGCLVAERHKDIQSQMQVFFMMA